MRASPANERKKDDEMEEEETDLNQKGRWRACARDGAIDLHDVKIEPCVGLRRMREGNV